MWQPFRFDLTPLYAFSTNLFYEQKLVKRNSTIDFYDHRIKPRIPRISQ